MALVERIKGILVDPRAAWATIASESTSVQSIYTGWIMILAAIGPIAMLVGYASLGVPWALRLAIGSYVLTLAMTALLALIVDVLAPSFGGQKDFIASLKLVAYSCTIVWLVAIVHVLGAYASLLMWIAGIYAIYTFYLGAPALRKCSADKAIPFTLIVVLCAVAIFFIAGFAMGMRRPL
ncbi:MAG: Yip1 family protein [Betaproteobacteria bacterium]